MPAGSGGGESCESLSPAPAAPAPAIQNSAGMGQGRTGGTVPRRGQGAGIVPGSFPWSKMSEWGWTQPCLRPEEPQEHPTAPPWLPPPALLLLLSPRWDQPRSEQNSREFWISLHTLGPLPGTAGAAQGGWGAQPWRCPGKGWGCAQSSGLGAGWGWAQPALHDLGGVFHPQ